MWATAQWLLVSGLFSIYTANFALMEYGVQKAEAFSLSILIHSGYFFTFVGLGLYFLGREHLGLSDLKVASAKEG